EGLVDRRLVLDEVRGDLGERAPDERADDAEPVEAAQRVRARVEDLALGVEPDEAVADARGAAPRARRGVGERELATRDHRDEVVRGLDVVELEPAGRAPAAEVRLPRDDRDRPPVVHDGDGLLTDRVRAEPARLARALRARLGEGALELGALTLGRERPDDVVVVHGRTGRRATLRDGDEVAVRRG